MDFFFKNNFKIGRHLLGSKNRTYFIAEAGSNHNGKIENVIKLIECASEAGADGIKFQLFKAEKLIKNKKDINALKKIEFNRSWIPSIKKFCEKKKINLIFSPFDSEAIDVIVKNKLNVIKIASSENLKHEIVAKSAKTKIPLIISTGMSNLSDINETVELIKHMKNNKIALMQCTSLYPCDYNKVNLSMITKLKEMYNFPVGFSDHSLGITACIAATALKSSVIEKHFTLDRKMEGPDHSYSIEPIELKLLLQEIRKIEIMHGKPEKFLYDEEKNFNRVYGIYANKNLSMGQKINAKDIKVDWPQKGIPKRYLGLVIGKRLAKKIKYGQAIKWQDLKI